MDPTLRHLDLTKFLLKNTVKKVDLNYQKPLGSYEKQMTGPDCASINFSRRPSILPHILMHVSENRLKIHI